MGRCSRNVARSKAGGATASETSITAALIRADSVCTLCIGITIMLVGLIRGVTLILVYMHGKSCVTTATQAVAQHTEARFVLCP